MTRMVLPNKGRLAKKSAELLEKAGIRMEQPNAVEERRLWSKTSHEDITIMFARASDIPRYIEEGVADLGICGYDTLSEEEFRGEEILDLEFGKCRLALACPENSGIRSLADIKKEVKIATQFTNLARKYFKSKKISAEIIPLSGAAEIAPHVGFSDMIVDLVSTGNTLKAHNLRIVDVLLESSARLIGKKGASEKFEGIALALKSVVDADGKKYLMMNVPKKKLDEITRMLPTMKSPTVLDLRDPEFAAVHAVVSECDMLSLIKKLKEKGAQDILVTPIERIIK